MSKQKTSRWNPNMKYGDYERDFLGKKGNINHNLIREDYETIQKIRNQNKNDAKLILQCKTLSKKAKQYLNKIADYGFFKNDDGVLIGVNIDCDCKWGKKKRPITRNRYKFVGYNKKAYRINKLSGDKFIKIWN